MPTSCRLTRRSSGLCLRRASCLRLAGKTDLAVQGPEDFKQVPVAFSRGDGGFIATDVANAASDAWFEHAGAIGVQIVACDVNGDGCDDLVLSGVGDLRTVPTALSNCDGTFSVTVHTVDNFPTYAESISGQTLLCADVNNDGKADLLLNAVGGTSRVAFSLGGGNYRVITHDLPGWHCEADQRPVVGDVSRRRPERGPCREACIGRGPCRGLDGSCVRASLRQFNGDGCADLSCPHVSADEMHTAFGQCDGRFVMASTQAITYHASTNGEPFEWRAWLEEQHVLMIAVDINGDGADDLVLSGGEEWSYVPIAFSRGDGSFYVATTQSKDFSEWAAYEGAQIVAGDWNGDGKGDLAVTSIKGATASTLPSTEPEVDRPNAPPLTVAGSLASGPVGVALSHSVFEVGPLYLSKQPAHPVPATASPPPPTKVVTNTGGDWTKGDCPAGWTLISGGCDAYGSGRWWSRTPAAYAASDALRRLAPGRRPVEDAVQWAIGR